MKTEEIKNIYNSIVPDKFESNYEYNRWFKNPILEAGYDMTKKSIEYHLLQGGLYPAERGKVENYIELGPGAGTWTKLFREKYDASSFDLVDISAEMLGLAKKALQKYDNIRFFETDFLEFQPDKKYDFFFSSRAVEYFPDKAILINKIAGLINSEGGGFIITKTPKYLRKKILRQKTSDFHKGQVSPKKLKKLLINNGCGEIKIYPVVVNFPIFKSVFLSKLLFKLFYRFPLNFISRFFAESYCVKFKKL